MTLRDLIAGAGLEPAAAGEDRDHGARLRSASVTPGTLFFCVRGSPRDGHDFAADAVARGAAALVMRAAARAGRARRSSCRRARRDGAARGRLLRRSDRELRVVGVTGTNGKTTTAFLVRALLEAAGIQTRLLGTVRSFVGGERASRSSARRPRRSTCSATSARCSTAGTRPA